MSTDQAAAPAQASPIVGDPQASGAIPAREARGAASESPYSVAESGEIVHLVAPTYPLTARRKGIEGAVLLRVRFDASGRPEDISVMTSSGSAMLDDAARDAVMRWRFRGGVAGSLELPITFRLVAAAAGEASLVHQGALQ
jgi:periplasmic protein TonB